MRRTILGLALLAAAAGLAACGSSGGSGHPSAAPSNGVADKAPDQILRSAIAAMRSARSVRLNGSITQSARTVTLDASIFADGDLSGTFVVNGSRLSLVKLGSTDYIKATERFYLSESVPAAVARELGGVWVSLPDSQAGFGNQFSIDDFAKQLDSAKGPITAGTVTTLDGVPVVTIHAADGGTLYVATTGPPYPLEAVKGSAANGSGTLTLSGWNAQTAPSPPAGARPVSSFSG